MENNNYNNNYVASEIAKNNKGESDAIEGYFKLLTMPNLPKEFYDDIREIISDEMNHNEKLMKWVEKFGGVMPAKT
ncbi:MAG: hypothetical protein FWD32_02170 [Firmicutes bacterium]|nr:hypothetical protein [Bacillota bacterium]